MKKTLSAVLAFLMILSAFAFTGGSVLASSEYPVVSSTVTTKADLFTATVDCQRANVTTDIYYGEKATKYDPIRTTTMVYHNSQKKDVDASAQEAVIEGYGRVPNNNSIATATNKLDARIYKYVAIKYYYEVTHVNEPSAKYFRINGLASGLPSGTSSVGAVISNELVTNKWAYAIFNLGAAATESKYCIFQYHLSPFVNASKNPLTGKNIPAGEAMIFEGMYYATDLTELGIVDPVVVEGTEIGTATTLSDCKAGLVAADTSEEISADLKAGHKVAYVSYVAVGDGVGSIKVNIGGTDYPVIKTITEENTVTNDAFTTGKWATAVVDVSAAGASTAQTIKVTPAANQKIFIRNITFAMEAPSFNTEFKIPKYDSVGALISVQPDFVKTGSDLSDVTLTGFDGEVIDFIGAKAYKLTPNVGESAYSIGAVALFKTEWQPYVRVEYYMYGEDSQTITGTPALKIGSTVITAAEPLKANEWAAATFDVSSILNTDAMEITFLPYGEPKAFSPTANNKFYLQSISVSQTENTATPAYGAPDLDEHGEVKAYSYVDPEGGAVAYYRIGGAYKGVPSGSSSLNAYGSLTAAVNALDAVGGGTLVCFSDIGLYSGTDISESSPYVEDGINHFPFPKHTNMIKLRGTEERRLTISCKNQQIINGPLWLEKYVYVTNATSSKGDCGFYMAGNKGVFGIPGGADDDILWNHANGALNLMGGADGGTFKQVDLTFYSGEGPTQLRILGGWGGTNITGDVNVNIYGGDWTRSAVKGEHGNGSGAKTNAVSGDYNVNVFGGKFASLNVLGSTQVNINGDVNVNLEGGTFTGTIAAFSGTAIKVAGDVAANIIKTPELKSKLNVASFKSIYAVTSEQSGENVLAGINAVTAGSTASTAFGGVVKATGDGLTASADFTEPTHAAKITFTGTKLTLAANTTYTLSGPVDFTDIEIESNEGSVIDAGDNKISFDKNVNITGPVKIIGTKIEFVKNLSDFTVLADELHGYAPKNTTTLIDLETAKILKPTFNASINLGKSVSSDIKGGAVVYYVTSLSADKQIPGKMKIEDNMGNVQVIENLLVNEWGTAAFDASVFAGASTITFTPYFETEIPSNFHLYIHSLSFAENSISYSLDYGTVETDRFGEVIIPADDVVIPGINWINRVDAGDMRTEEKAFVTGQTTMFTPIGVAPFASYRLDASVNPEWQPYVKVEYYLHANDDDAIPSDLKMVAKFGDNTIIEAEQVITTNVSAIATFNIASLPQNFNTITLYPYSEDASAFDSNNKIYIGNVKVSKDADTTVPEIKAPKLDEEGLLIPYKYVPEDGKAVVYVSSVGTYTGDYTGSINSTVAYGKLSDAFAALKGIGGYVIFCDDYQLCSGAAGSYTTGHFPSHSDMMILRGMENEDGSKTKLKCYFMTNASGPLTFENIDLHWLAGGNDNSLQMGSNLVVLGKPGVPNDVVFTGVTTPMFTTGNMVVNGATVPTIRLGTYGSAASYNSLNFTINEGGTIGTISPAWGSGSCTVTGDVNVTVNGGSVGAGFRPFNGTQALKVGGNINFKITGGDFSAIPAKGFKSLPNTSSTCAGKKIIDILDYEGDTSALIAKIDQSSFDILMINSVYVSSESGDNANDGLTSSTPVATIENAIQKLSAVPSGGNTNGVYSGRIMIMDLDVSDTDSGEYNGDSAELLILGYNDSSTITIHEGAFLSLTTPTKFKDIKFAVDSDVTAGIYANGNSLAMDDGITVTKTKSEGLTLVGGNADTAPKANITVNSGTYSDIVGSMGDIEGASNITVNGGTIEGKVVGGSVNGNVGEGTTVTVNNGTFGANSGIIGGNVTPNTSVSGDIIVSIKNGNFNAMQAGAIVSGESDNLSTERKLNISGFEGAGLTGKYNSTTFDRVIIPKPAAPASGKPFVWILQEITTQANGLVKAKPFTITQTVQQSGSPVVVSPKQLNIKMDGNDHALMSIQMLADGVTETIRFTPNHNPTKGSSIVVDGYNISGRGVDMAKYKYAEVIYYYNVPEDQEQKIQAMELRPLSAHSNMGTLKSTPVVANKWATAIIDIGTVAAEKGSTGDLKQYHFAPYGALKGPDVPVEQCLDIVSMTFYTEKPATTIAGGAKPSAKAPVATETIKLPGTTTTAAVKYDPLVVKGTNLISQIDKSGAFEGSASTFDGVPVGKIVPNLESSKSVSVEGFGRIPATTASPKGVIDTRKYRYVVLKYYYETKTSTAVPAVPTMAVYGGGLANDPNVVKGGLFTSITPITDLKVNAWNYAVFDINPADQEKFNSMQFHLSPIGNGAANKAPAGDIIYVESFTFYAKMPNLNAEAEEEEVVEEIVEDALTDADIVAKDPTIVVPEALRYAVDNNGSFTAKSTTFEEKNVIAITPNTYSSNPVDIDGTYAVTADNGSISLKNYRYAVITYYFKTSKAAEYKAPAITLLSLGVRSEDGAIGEQTYTASEALKANEWATATIKLSGTQTKFLARGFILSPFGTMNGSSFSIGDTLYIENVKFVTDIEE